MKMKSKGFFLVLALLLCHASNGFRKSSIALASSFLRMSTQEGTSQKYPPHIHSKEYPFDDYSHILGIDDPNHEPSKLQTICHKRILEVERLKKPIDTDGCGIDRSFYISIDDYVEQVMEFDAQYGKPLDLAERIGKVYPKMAIAAEFKRASPSKGDINLNLDVVEQCLEYTRVGAAVISVLTEFLHFKGTLDDMKRVRLATQKEFGSERPAILRKDFVLDRYQVIEARANGADTVLLIVAVLGVEQLKDLMSYSRSFGMEPLVEVHTDREMEIALECGARVIGINNRNLHTFKLDLDTTRRVLTIAAKNNITWRPTSSSPIPDVTMAALSGITSSADVRQFRDEGVSCCLIGETLMKAADPKATINELIGEDSDDKGGVEQRKAKLVKMCGFKDTVDVAAALQAGANMVGVIFAPKSPRKVSTAEARAIVEVTRRYGERTSPISLDADIQGGLPSSSSSLQWYSHMIDAISHKTVRTPLVVGVFQNQTPEEINKIIAETGIDVVQLHGDESADIVSQINAPCIKVIHVSAVSHSNPSIGTTDEVISSILTNIEEFKHKAVAVLLDSQLPGQTGGTGAIFDWTLASRLQGIPIILAGGLTSQNVGDACKVHGVAGIDVSSGLEMGTPGKKEHNLIKDLMSSVRS